MVAGKYDKLTLGHLKKAKFGGDTAYEMSVGNHLIKGKLTNLDKPLLFTKKNVNYHDQ